jgi:WD40 repeat protein
MALLVVTIRARLSVAQISATIFPTMPSEPELMQRSQHQILADLRNAAALLYPEESSARVIVDDAGLDARQIAFSSRAESNWHNIWLTAIRQNQTDALVAVLADRYPSHPPLQAAIANYRHFLAAGGQFNAQALLADSAPDDDVPAPGESPYQGMAYYDVADADRFFGREALTAELVDHLRQQPLLAVVGASGSGKSSLVRAGVMPALQGKMPLVDGKPPPAGSARWAYHLITPTARPLESLAASLTRSSESVTATSTLIDDLGRDARSLHLYARRLVSGEQRLLLLVDQFEELFTLCKNETEQGAFVDNLLYAAQPDNDPKNSVVTLVLTLRADFYHHCARFPALRTALENQQKYIGAMTRDELRRAIAEPAKAGQWEFQAGLVEQLLQDVGNEPGALPLLSHALLETWQRRRGRTLTLAGYRAAGGVQGAIAKTADDVFSRFTDEQKTIARIIFLRLTELGEGVQDTRRRVRPDELKLTHADTDEVLQVLKTLADARLVTTDDDEIQVSHEALIRNWGTLREWLDDDREGNRIQRRLTEAANQWVEFGKDPSLLYRGVLLQQAQVWLRTTNNPPNQRESEFLHASLVETQVQIQREAQIQIRGIWLRRVSFALVIAILATIVAFWQFRIATDERGQAQGAATEAAQARATSDENANLANKQRLQAQIAATSEAKARSTSDANAIIAEQAKIAAEAARNESNKLKEQIRADQIAQQALLANIDTTLEQYPLRAILLAVEAVKATTPPVPSALQSLYDLLGRTRGHVLGQFYGRHLAFSPDSKILASSAGKTIQLWSVYKENSVPVILEGHEDSINSLAFSFDGRILASASWDHTIRLWSLTNLNEDPLVLKGHKGSVTDVAFSSDGKWLASTGDDNSIRLWAMSKIDNLSPTSEWYEKSVSKVIFSPDSKTLASISKGSKIIRLWSVLKPNAEPIVLQSEKIIGDIAFAPNGKTLASVGADGIHFWSLDNLNSAPVLLKGQEGSIFGIEFSPDSKLLASFGLEGLHLWVLDTPDSEPISLNGHEGPVWNVAFSPDRKMLASTGGEQIRLWPIGQPSSVPTRFQGYTNGISTVAFSPDGTILASGNWDDTIQLWSPTSSSIIGLMFDGHESDINSVTFSPDGKTLASASSDGTVRLWSPDNLDNKPQLLRGHGVRITSIAFSPDNKNLVAGNWDNTIQLWSLPELKSQLISPDIDEDISLNGRMGITIDNHVLISLNETPIYSVAFSPDGETIAAASGDRTIRLWRLKQLNHEPTVLRGHGSAAMSVAFSPDGKTLVSGDAAGFIRLWALADLSREPMVLKGHEDVIYSVAFSPDGRIIASGSRDRTIRLWSLSELDNKPLILKLVGGSGNDIVNIAFSPDGTMIAAAALYAGVNLWPLQAEGLSTIACAVAGRNLNMEEWLQYFPDEEYRRTCLTKPIPWDVIRAIKDNAKEQIRAGQTLSATRRLEELNIWLYANGQFKDYGVDVNAFITESVSAIATLEALFTPTPTPMVTTSPLQPISPLNGQLTSPLPSPTIMQQPTRTLVLPSPLPSPTATPPATGTPVASAPVATPVQSMTSTRSLP